jgi:predicted nucleotidyltransferase
MFDWYKGNLKWLPERTIYLTKHGSHAYGTSRPDSDLDIRGICIPPKEYFLGFLNRFEQAESKDPDVCVYDIRKFLELATNNNPNVIELLYTDPVDHILVTPLAAKLIENRDLLLSQKTKHTFSGYAISQLKRIKTHRRWLLDPPKKKPEREDFGLPSNLKIPENQRRAAESQMLKLVENWKVDLAMVDDAARIDLLNRIAEAMADMDLSLDRQWEAAGRKLGFDDNFLLYLGHERSYNGALNDWKHYQDWVRNRNVIRADLEAKYGYDTKHGMHLVRLMRMAKEILSGQGVLVKRPDAAELMDIRNGVWSYDRLIEWAEATEKELEQLVLTTTLPKSPNRNKFDQLCVQLTEISFRFKDLTTVIAWA